MSNIKKYFAYLSRALKRMRYFPWCIPILDTINKTLSIIGIRIPFLLDKMDDAILSFLDKEFGEVICAYADMPEPEPNDENNGIIWTCWFQGEENAPFLVKKCIESIRRNAREHPVVVVTLENMSQYADIPEHILELVNSGKLSLTHLSDILRMKLLAAHGGLWFDSTMLYVRPIDELLWSEPFFSPPATMYKKLHAFDSRGKALWCICMQMAKKGHPLYLCMSEFYDAFFKKYPIEPHYFLTDYIGFLVMKKLRVENSAKALGCSERVYVYMINSPAAGQLPAESFPPVHLFKLTYKKEWPEFTPDGKRTVYGELVKQ